MHIEYPEYYNKFHCLAGDCPDTCCKDWEVDVDEDTFYYYKVQEGELGKKLEQCLVEDGDLKYIPMKKDGSCPFLTEGSCVRFAAASEKRDSVRSVRSIPAIIWESVIMSRWI